MRFSTAINTNPALQTMYGNSLDKFKTYSYHHLWVVGKNTDAVTKFLNDEVSLMQLLNQQNRKEDGGFRKINNGLCVLVNGARDSDFSIERLTFEAVVVGQKVSAGANTLPSLSGSIDILEPQGIRFLNVLREIYQSLGVMNVNAIHALKTIFVGATNGSTGTDSLTIEYVTNVPPIIFAVTDMKLSVTNQGSFYTIDFTHISSIASAPAIANSGKGVLLRMGGTIRAELNSIAEQYTRYCIENAETITDPLINKKPIKYKIKLDNTIREIGDWVVTDQKSIRTEGQGKTNAVSLNGNIPIERAIEMVITGSKQYLDQFLAHTENSFTYMVIPCYTINAAEEPEMLFRITKHPIGQTVVSNDAAIKNDKVDVTERFGPTSRVLIFDYIFTGKNTDIESLDMRIEEGLAFLQTVTATQNVSQTPQVRTSSTDGIVATQDAAYLKDTSETPKRLNGSVSPPRLSDTITGKHHNLDQRKIQYDELLQQAFSLEAAKMGMLLGIRGNPGFISCFALQPGAIQDMSSVKTANTTTEFSSAIYSDLPLICVNIMMPVTWTTASGNIYDPEMEPYWYQGLWQLMKVVTNFVGGKFSQELTLLAVPSFPTTTAIGRPVTTDAQPVKPVAPKPGKPVATPSTTDTPSAPPRTPTSKPNTSVPDSPTQLNGRFLLGSVDYTTRITRDYTFGEMIKTSHANWQKGENNPPSQEILDNIVNTLEQFQKVRDALGSPCLISSGYRSPTVNASVGGSSTSDHKNGMAIDFVAPGYGTPADIVAAIRAMDIPYKQLILEQPPGRKHWVHIAFSRTAASNRRDTRVFNGASYLPYTARG